MISSPRNTAELSLFSWFVRPGLADGFDLLVYLKELRIKSIKLREIEEQVEGFPFSASVQGDGSRWKEHMVKSGKLISWNMRVINTLKLNKSKHLSQSIPKIRIKKSNWEHSEFISAILTFLNLPIASRLELFARPLGFWLMFFEQQSVFFKEKLESFTNISEELTCYSLPHKTLLPTTFTLRLFCFQPISQSSKSLPLSNVCFLIVLFNYENACLCSNKANQQLFPAWMRF